MSPAPDDIYPNRESDSADINDGLVERSIFLVGGGALTVYGLRRGKLAAMLGGTALLYRGVAGYWPFYRWRDAETKRWQIEESITVHKPVEEVYSRWRRIEDFPCLMSHLESVNRVDGAQSHWVAKNPLRLEWDAEITDEEENRKISWRSLPGSRIEHVGSVFFHSVPARNSTELKIIISYRPPGGSLGAAAAKWLGGLGANQIREDLRSFKAFIEAGERPTNVSRRDGGKEN
jgi:uncharacterized membrane protein